MATMCINVKNINDGNIVAKDVLMRNGTFIMAIGSVLKKAYINRLLELGINYVYIFDDIEKDINSEETTEYKIQKQYKDAVRMTIDKYSYSDKAELQDINMVADAIINDIINDPIVMYNVSQVRDQNESIYSHSVNVSALAILIGLKMKLAKKRVKETAIGALLHDIGIIYLPYDLFLISYNELTEEQLTKYRNHVVIGYSVVEKEKWLSKTAKEIIFTHHERCDGSGYPMHKTDEHLKMEVKIVSVCDFYDSCIYGNFTQKLRIQEANDYLISRAGKEFDIDVVNAFVASVAAYPIGTYVHTNTNELAVVIRQNNKLPTRPVIRLLKDADGNEYEHPVEKDLTEELTLFIKDTL